jgi:hypothetical protein
VEESPGQHGGDEEQDADGLIATEVALLDVAAGATFSKLGLILVSEIQGKSFRLELSWEV